METLKEVREYLNSIPNINRGGCLISAYSMYLFLKKTNQLPKDFKILQISGNDMQRFLLTRQLGDTDPSKFAAGCDHAMCLVDGIVFDSGESRPLNIDIIATICSVPVDPETQSQYVIAQINTEGWNPSFDRSIYVSEIEQKLGINLSMVKRKFTNEDKARADAIIENENNRVREAVRDYKKSISNSSSLTTVENKMIQDAFSKIFG